MSFICTCMSLVCHPYITRIYSYVIRISLLCTRMSSVCHSYVLVCHVYVTRMASVCHSYVIRMSRVCTRMSPVCHSCVLICHPYVTRLWFYHEPCTKWCDGIAIYPNSMHKNDLMLYYRLYYSYKMFIVQGNLKWKGHHLQYLSLKHSVTIPVLCPERS